MESLQSISSLEYIHNQISLLIVINIEDSVPDFLVEVKAFLTQKTPEILIVYTSGFPETFPVSNQS